MLLRIGEVQGMPYEYCWFPYLIRENLNLIAGDGGTGKSYLILAIAAAITNGCKPEGMPGRLEESGNVLLCSTEDDAPQIRDRFDKLGGNPEKLFMPPPGSYADLHNTASLQGMIRESSAKLVIFDPVQSFLTGTDLNKASDIRPLLDGLRNLCRQEHCTGLLLAHSNKAEKMGKAQYRVSGTGDFVNGCRSALLVGFHPSEAGIRVGAHMKSNGEYGQSFRFTIENDGSFHWMGEDTSSAEEIMNAPRIKRAQKSVISANPVTLLIAREVERHGGAWEVSSAEMPIAARAYPELIQLHTLPYVSVGSAVREDLKKQGIASNRPNRNHKWYFVKAPQAGIANGLS